MKATWRGAREIVVLPRVGATTVDKMRGKNGGTAEPPSLKDGRSIQGAEYAAREGQKRGFGDLELMRTSNMRGPVKPD